MSKRSTDGVRIATQKFNHAGMMEGPDRKISVFNKNHSLRQIGWLGASGAFYPVYIPEVIIRGFEPGSYAPVYMEIGD